MNEETFWKIIDEANVKTADGGSRNQMIKAELIKMPTEEVEDFGRIMSRLVNAAYNWDLWAADFITHTKIESDGSLRYSSDDNFEYFRAGLIGMGRQVYETAIKDPEFLAQLEPIPRDVDLFCVSAEILEERECSIDINRQPAPQHPSGKSFDERDLKALSIRFPRLFERFIEPLLEKMGRSRTAPQKEPG